MASKIKVMHLIGSLTKGGAERFVVDLCNELAKDERYEVSLLSLCDNDMERGFRKEIQDQVRYTSFGKGPGINFLVMFRLTSWLKTEKPDILHSHLNGLEYLVLYFAGRSATRFFHTLHNIAGKECPNYFVRIFRKACYKKNQVQAITISEDVSKSFQAGYGLDNDMLIPNGRPELVRSPAFKEVFKEHRLTPDSFLLVHVARIAAQKNQKLLIKAVQQFNATEVKKCTLLLIGEARNRQLYQQLQNLASGDPAIRFLGGKYNVADYLSLADAFCLSSFYEGMPISIIEAFSVGCIPICTPVSGIKNMIRHGENGFLSKDSSVDSYCSAIKEALYHPDQPMIRYKGKQSFRLNYHISITAHNYRMAYQQHLPEFQELPHLNRNHLTTSI